MDYWPNVSCAYDERTIGACKKSEFLYYPHDGNPPPAWHPTSEEERHDASKERTKRFDRIIYG
jgi:hypothetical protein